ncbi:hypothetical protein CANCADRAFT_134275 [Tortispora caseinolytica NRRL Y-17796]|uniref:Vacuolar calcium ion transporter n=1 Tax=Tortispora caseinolytica NRRL Y-17796 TaxID=767744 RepID=A0A1E4TBM6_9ASCO|nr:hypothetical protein CANCADRAFT_134275 [Tortispora caseinolytica NRRL Y-17796]
MESAPLLASPRRSPALKQEIKALATSSYVNYLLVFVPLGLAAGLLNWPAVYKFSLNFLAVIPLASLLGFATEELALYVGESIGGLLNATFGNAVELIVAVVALYQGQIAIVQASMLGSILSNMLLVLGCCFILGGMKYKVQNFSSSAALAMSSLMAVSCSCLLLPAAFHATIPPPNGVPDGSTGDLVVTMSRSTSVVMLILYVLFLLFQFKTHSDMFETETDETPEVPTLSSTVALTSLALVTVVVAVCADYLVGSIDDIVETTGMPKEFIGLILIPIVGNAAEHASAVMVAMKNKMNLAIGIAVGSSLQIALFMTPFTVVVGWMIGQNMTLFFSTYETAVMFVSVFITNYLIQDGESNWFEGALLIGTYIIIGLSFWLYP